MVHYAHIQWGRTSMIELVQDLRVINVLAKFENDPWKIMDMRVLTGLVCPAARPPARPLGRRQSPGALKGCGVKSSENFPVAGSSADTPVLSVCGHQGPKKWPSHDTNQYSSRHLLCKYVYQIWRLYIIAEAINEENYTDTFLVVK